MHITILQGKNYPYFLEQMRLNKLKFFDESHLVNGGMELLLGYKVQDPKPVIFTISLHLSAQSCLIGSV